MPGLSMGALRVVLLLKESGSNRPVMLGKRMGVGIRQTWLCYLIVVCFGTHLSGPGLPLLPNEGDIIHQS